MMVLQHRRKKSSLLSSAEIEPVGESPPPQRHASLGSIRPLSPHDPDVSSERAKVEEPWFVEVKEMKIDGEGTVVFSRGGDEKKRESIATFSFAPIPTVNIVEETNAPINQSVDSVLAWDEMNSGKLVIAQAYVRRFLARKLCKRLKIVQELIQTETRYINSLRLLIKLFMEPLEVRITEGRPILEPQIVLDIFSCIRELLNLHEAFLQKLQSRVENTSAFGTHTIADIFLQHTKFLLLYPLYVNNFDLAAATLKKHKANNAEFAEFVHSRERRPEMKLQDVESLLLMPVQRIPQYTLLIQDLLKQCKPNTIQHADLTSALQHLRDSLAHINEQKRDAENAAHLQALLQHFSYRSKKDHLPSNKRRRLLSEGPVTLYQKGKGKQLWLFVMSDALVMAKPKGKKQSTPGISSPRAPPVGQKTPLNDYTVKHIEFLKELYMLSIPSTPPLGNEGRFTVHGARGLKVEFGAEGGPRAAEAWVRSIQLALLAFQHQAKRKYLKTTMRRTLTQEQTKVLTPRSPSESPRDRSILTPPPARPTASSPAHRATVAGLFSSTSSS